MLKIKIRDILVKIGSSIKKRYGVKRPIKMGATSKVGIAVLLFTTIVYTIVVLSFGGLKSGSGIGQVILWLLITVTGIIGTIGVITFMVKANKTSWSKYLLLAVITLVIVLFAVGLWKLWNSLDTLSQFLKSPSLKTINAFTKDYWLWILIVGTISYVLLSFISKKELTKMLRGVVALTVFLLFIGFPVIGWFAETDSHEQKQLGRTEIICPDASALETRHCIINTEWSNWIKPAEGAADNGLYLRYGPQESVICECELENGTSLYRFRAKEGQVVLSYRLVPANQLHLEKLL